MDVITKSATADLTLVRTRLYNNTVTTSHYTGRRFSGFTKPDKPVRNELVDGYRKPSNYKTTLKSTSIYERYPLAVTVQGDGVVGTGVNAYRYQWSGVDVLSTNAVGQPTGPSVQELRTRVLNDISNEVFDVAMVLGEMQGTLDLISNNSERLARSLIFLQQKRPKEAFYLMFGKRKDGKRLTDGFLRDSASVYLEWKYGVMPTVYDIEGATAAMDMNREGNFFETAPLLVARSRLRQEYPQTRDMQGFHGSLRHRKLPVNWIRERRARCDYRVDGEGLRGLNRYGLGLSTLPTLVFERTPFSFVANMVVPMAEIIKAWSALSGTKVVGYCETDYARMDIPAGQLQLSVLGNPLMQWKASEKVCEYFTRTAFSQPPMPLPFIRNPLKTGNLSTVLALFTQLRNPQGYK